MIGGDALRIRGNALKIPGRRVDNQSGCVEHRRRTHRDTEAIGGLWGVFGNPVGGVESQYGRVDNPDGVLRGVLSLCDFLAGLICIEDMLVPVI